MNRVCFHRMFLAIWILGTATISSTSRAQTTRDSSSGNADIIGVLFDALVDVDFTREEAEKHGEQSLGLYEIRKENEALVTYEFHRNRPDRIFLTVPDEKGRFGKNFFGAGRHGTKTLLYEGKIQRIRVESAAKVPAEIAKRITFFVRRYPEHLSEDSYYNCTVVGIKEGTLFILRDGSKAVRVSFLPQQFPNMVLAGWRKSNERGNPYRVVSIESREKEADSSSRTFSSWLIKDHENKYGILLSKGVTSLGAISSRFVNWFESTIFGVRIAAENARTDQERQIAGNFSENIFIPFGSLLSPPPPPGLKIAVEKEPMNGDLKPTLCFSLHR